MSARSFISSAVLHGVVLTLMAMDFSLTRFDSTPPPPAILTIDLTRVQIADKTNLPSKAEVRPKKDPPKKAAPPPPKQKIQPTRITPPPAQPKPVPVPLPKEAAPIIEPPKQKDNPPPEKPQDSPKPSADDRLKNLLTSVEKVRREAPTTQIPPQQTPNTSAAGSEGDLSRILTISDRDLIAQRLSRCWNLDAGKQNIEDLIVEIRAHVNRDGSVREVTILNDSLSSVAQSVAESARRAVWICDRDPEKSPFKTLAEKYADHYSDWKTVTLRFNPLTHGIN